ncbi:MAG: hypothetical protein ACAI44_13155 [Candidatus Sericytochromatia bacterium]
MSFMSFDYAMRAADAALQFQQSQGQNIKDTNARTREVGTGNAKRKDDLVRQTIEADYEAKSADIKKEKMQKLAKLADEKKQMAFLTTALVAGGTFLGGLIDGALDCGNKKGVAPDSEQMGISSDMIKDGYATSFRIAGGTGNSEQGAVVAFDTNKGNFSMVGVNTTNGQVNGFVQMSATDMASHILNTTKDDPQHANLRSMIDQGPPPMFKASCFEQKDGKFELKGGLKEELFGGPNGNPAGFFAEGSRVGAPVNSPQTAGDLMTRLNAGPQGVANSAAADILTKIKDDTSPEADKMRGLIDQGPPPKFKPGVCTIDPKDGSLKLNDDLRDAVRDPKFQAFGARLNSVKDDPAQNKLRGMIDQGPPAKFNDKGVTKNANGEEELTPGLQAALQDPRFRDIPNSAGLGVGNESGELLAARLLKNPAPISMAYGPTANNILDVLGNKDIQNGLQIDGNTVDKTRKSFEDSGALEYGTSVGQGFNKVLFKPLGNALNQFMQLAQVAKQYDEEYKQKMVEYEAAKAQAAKAREKLQKLQSMLVAGSNS